MAHIKPLSEFFRLYANGDMPRNDLEGHLFQYLLENPGRYKVFEGNRDRWGDFISWLYSRLSRAIDLYKDTGSSFDSYITGIIHTAAREYRSREAEQNLTEYACWQARAEEMKLFESEPVYNEAEKSKVEPIDINPRQLLFLLLKSYYFATDKMVKEVARLNDLKSSEVRKMIDKLRNIRSEKDAIVRELRDRLYLQHYRCLAYQKRMNNSQPGTEYYDRMKGMFYRARKRYNAMKKRLEGKRRAASNRMIAEVLGIPLGTVDSGLSTIKNRLAAFM